MEYFCKVCGGVDLEGISGHHTRCPLPQKVANKKTELVANTVVANKHGVYKDKEARLAYMKELMRKRRAVQV